MNHAIKTLQRQVLSGFLGVGLAVSISLTAFAQPAANWPIRPVKIIVPEPPGGGMDVGARLVGALLAAELGQPFIIENLPGAANTVGTAAVARAKPDGYTLLHTSQSAICIVPLVSKDISYKVSDLSPIGQSMATTNTFVINPGSVPARTLPDLIKLLKASPGKYTYGSSGIAGWSHLIHELFMLKTGTQITHVPYGGAAAVKIALLGGQVNMGIVSTTVVLEEIRSGRLYAIAVPTPERLPEMSNVPAINETVTDFGGLKTWNGFFAPVGTPRPVIERLSKLLAAYIHNPQVEERIKNMGATSVGSSPEEFAALIKRETELWKSVISDRKLSLE
jgi:tripartite-type tricarboxylate transporter receptor subunit TctC